MEEKDRSWIPRSLLRGGFIIIVDLQNVNFISSSGMLTFVKIQRKFKQQNKGEVIFIRVPELIYRSFEIAGFNTIFKFFDAFETAQANFSSPEE